MYDYAQVQMLGRATSDAEIYQPDEVGPGGSTHPVTKVTFTLALNIPIRRGDQIQTKTVYRRVMALGSFASYVVKCQEEDGLKGRLINVCGVMDDERFKVDAGVAFRDVVRVAPGSGAIKIMDRRQRHG